MLIVYLHAGIVIAAALQAGTGFGFSLLAMPLLLLCFTITDAVQLNLMLSLILSLGMIRHISDQIDRGLLKRLLIGGLVAVPFAIPLMGVSGPIYRLSVGLGLMSLVLLLVISPKMPQSPVADYLTGGASLVMTLVFGMPGPPLMFYFSATDRDKAAVRGTTLAFFLSAYFVGLCVHFIQNGVEIRIIHSLFALMPAFILGGAIGRWAYPRLTQKFFQFILLSVLAATGLVVMITSLKDF